MYQNSQNFKDILYELVLNAKENINGIDIFENVVNIIYEAKSLWLETDISWSLVNNKYARRAIYDFQGL